MTPRSRLDATSRVNDSDRPDHRTTDSLATCATFRLSPLLGIAVALAIIVTPAGAIGPIDDARQRLEAAQAVANAAAARYDETLRRRDDAVSRIDELQGSMGALRTRVADLRTRISKRAAALYRNVNPADGLALLGRNDIATAAHEAGLLQATAAADDRILAQLQQTTGELEGKENETRQLKAVLDNLLPRLDDERTRLDQQVAQANTALDFAEGTGVLREPGQEPVLGVTQLSPQQLADWYATTGRTPRLKGITIDELAVTFIDEGTAENVRGDLAFAQAYLETGGFTHGSVDNNFAGLGACDSCSEERRFPTPRDGVRAQIQHLRNYADRASRAAALRNPPSAWWYGQDPGVAARNYDHFFAKGWAPTWQLMGHGNWATDPNYATKILDIYQRMLTYAQQRP